MVFAANPVFVGFNDGIGKFVVPSRMVHASRQREVPFYVDWYRQRGFKIIEVDLGPDYLEGHGDLIWHPDGSRIYAGYGFRSTQGGVEKLSNAMCRYWERPNRESRSSQCISSTLTAITLIPASAR